MSESAKDKIFQSIREANRTIRAPEAYPEYEDSLLVSQAHLEFPDDLWNDFGRNFSAVNGRAMDSPVLLMSWLREQSCTFGYCAPELYQAIGLALENEAFEISCEFDRSRYDDYQFGITRASGAVAESGSVILTDQDTPDRLGALTPWIHIAVIRPAQLIPTIPEAIRQFGSHSNIIWVTGPSKTADVEGILIEGVHGPGEQVCLLLHES